MSYRVFLAALAALLMFSIGAEAFNYNNMQARVFFETKSQWTQLQGLHLDIVFREGNQVEIVTNQDELAKLDALGFRTEVIIDDIEKFVQSRFDKTRTMGGYLTLSEINAAIDVLIANHPDIVSAKVDIGHTILDQPMWAVKISDNPNVDEDETEVLFTAAIHAREVITPLVLLNVMDSLTEKYPSDPFIQNLVDNREIWFVLNVNPDGYYLNELIAPGGGGMWRKNLRNNGDGTYGIDLNRNFGYNWGYDNIGSSPYTNSETYRGTGPFSEPETQNMRDFTLAHNFQIVVYYHSASNLILWPWDYDYNLYTPDHNIFQAIGDSISSFNYYRPQVGWMFYLVNGGSGDWNYGEQTLKSKSYPFIIEIGSSATDGFWPPTSRIDDLVNENYWSTLFLAEASDSVEQVLEPIPPVLLVEDTVDNSNYAVSWTNNDLFNPGINFELIEYTDISRITDPGENLDNFTSIGFIIGYSRYHSGFTSLYSDAHTNFSARLITKYPVSILSGDIFRFWTYYRIESGIDYAYVAVSSNGVDWTNIAGNITTTSNPNGKNLGNGITGESGGWIRGEFDMSAYVGQCVYIAFIYNTDESIEYEGIYVDDIEMVTVFGTESVISSNIENTFYLFTDKPENTDFFYKVRAQDADLQWSDYSGVRRTHARIPYVCGDIDGINGVNILDVVFLINSIYKGGPDPEPPEAGNIDGIGGINILDVVHLINYIYKNGADPNCP
jgi:hypothetical protein